MTSSENFGNKMNYLFKRMNSFLSFKKYNDRHLPRQPTRSQQSGLSRLSPPGLSLSINNADRLKPYIQTAC